MLELIIGDGSGEVQNANIPIGWCVDQGTLNELKNMGAKNPHILIVTVVKNGEGHYQELTRHIAPFDQALEYVQFQRPGINKIYATIIWTKNGNNKTLWENYTKIEHGRHSTEVVYNKIGTFSKPKNSLEFFEVDVDIPKELFAKEYPKWLKWYINLWHDNAILKDQCHFKKEPYYQYQNSPFSQLGDS